jgi:hypothetical protein
MTRDEQQHPTFNGSPVLIGDDVTVQYGGEVRDGTVIKVFYTPGFGTSFTLVTDDRRQVTALSEQITRHVPAVRA